MFSLSADSLTWLVSLPSYTNNVFHKTHDFPQLRRDTPIDSHTTHIKICLLISYSSPLGVNDSSTHSDELNVSR
jgi:hypothetical protein